VNARRTDSLAARLSGLANQAENYWARQVVLSIAILADTEGAVFAQAFAIGVREQVQRAISLIESELAESESGKPKAARKQKRGAR
jgi:hypothetical protein